MTDDVRSNVLSSWLEKQAEWRFAWDKRFFVQDGLRLAYSLSAKGAERQTGHIISLQCSLGSNQPHCFRVWLEEGGCWTLRAATAGAHEQWTRSISAALLQDDETQHAQQENKHPREKREGLVMKKSARGGYWQQRYLEMDGIHLTYRVTKNDPVRQRFVVVVADSSIGNGLGDSECEDEEPRDSECEDEEPLDPCALFITTSTGERFWLRLATRACCADWARALHRALCRASPWHWHVLAPSPALRPLRAQFHAAAASGRRLYAFGGSASPSVVSPQTARRETVMRGLSRLRLAGEHCCAAVTARPFEESAHAKRCPAAAIGAGLCVVPAGPRSRSPHSSGNAVNSFGNGGGVREFVVLVGGRSGQAASRDAFSEMWCCAPGDRAPQWYLHRYAAAELPHMSFHTIVPRGPRVALIVGGIDDTDRMRAECFSLEWPANDNNDNDVGDMLATQPLVQLCAYLPEPRAFHACAALRDESIVVFGGCKSSDSVLRLASGSARWHSVAAEPPLPPLHCACAAAEPLGATLGLLRVFVLGEADGTSEARLFQIVFAEADPTRAGVREIAMEVGAVPRRCWGATLHCASGYLYAVGSGGGGNNGGDEAPLQDPVRAIIGDP